MLEPSPSRLELARSLVELGAALRRASHRVDARAPLRRGRELANACAATALEDQALTELRAPAPGRAGSGSPASTRSRPASGAWPSSPPAGSPTARSLKPNSSPQDPFRARVPEARPHVPQPAQPGACGRPRGLAHRLTSTAPSRDHVGRGHVRASASEPRWPKQRAHFAQLVINDRLPPANPDGEIGSRTRCPKSAGAFLSRRWISSLNGSSLGALDTR